ncbi:class I SAM-dependent methyltransferase [Rhodococcoides corynebacterioides]|uniref:class I SAM-dependent methyltransferase n=1 Tax=Rhodococcoides corynebacterioides TaxID=53972 RepID=UPI00083021BD|nr:class I SAM-dependent methyltransferase [Rhodococcus corynebacterioides]MBY6349445.1 class I SAM-dependent methyltransferase [Rhodococcus corynebacterioides]MBY6362647.1 class I SAM-dependent methyltransferase [Rhodococcus corynebacterioides]
MDAAAWDAKYDGRTPSPGSPPDDVLVEFVTSRPRGRALDLACGHGRNALWLAMRGWQVDAVDFSAVALSGAASVAATATRSIRERIRWVHADVTTLVPPREYDLVVASYLHLPPDARRAVMEAAIGALKHEGILIVIGHHTDNPTTGAPGPSDVEILYTPDDLVADLPGDATVRRAQTMSRRVGDATALDTVLVASVTGE